MDEAKKGLGLQAKARLLLESKRVRRAGDGPPPVKLRVGFLALPC